MRITGSVPVDPNDRFTQRIKGLEQQVAELQRNPVAAFSHSVSATRTASQTISTSTVTAVSFTATDAFDTDAMHDTGTNPSRLTVPAGLAGKWIVGYSSIRWASAAGDRSIWITVNGGSDNRRWAEQSDTSGGFVIQQGATLINLAAGDYIELKVFQTSGGNLDLTPTADLPLRFWATYQGR